MKTKAEFPRTQKTLKGHGKGPGKSWNFKLLFSQVIRINSLFFFFVVAFFRLVAFMFMLIYEAVMERECITMVVQ